MSERSLPEVRIVAVYLVLACAWFLGSEILLARFAIESPSLKFILPGLWILISAALLFVTLRHAYQGRRRSEQQRTLVIEDARNRIRHLSSQVQNLREEDRIRISREVHDELGQLLTGIKLEVRMLEKRLADRDDLTLNPQIDQLVEIAELVDATIASVQRIAVGLRPVALDHLGLATAMMEEAGLFSKRTGIPCNINFEDFESELPADFNTATFRIFQESLTNIARHAQADSVVATCTIQNGELTLTIRDNGKGMNLAMFQNPKTLGFLGIVERARIVGGRVSLKSEAMKGTEVVFKAPVPEAGSLPSGKTAAT